MLEVLEIGFVTIAIFMLVVMAVAKLVEGRSYAGITQDGRRLRLARESREYELAPDEYDAKSISKLIAACKAAESLIARYSVQEDAPEDADAVWNELKDIIAVFDERR